jgi:hypothetical protein
MLRALTYFDDAEREAELPGERRADWHTVRNYFLVQVGSLLVPPVRRLAPTGLADPRPRRSPAPPRILVA